MALDEQANPLVEPVKSALPSSKVVRSRASKWVSLCVACGATVAVVAAGRARVTSWSPAALDSFVVPGSKVGSPGAYAVAAPNVHDSSTTAFTVWNKYIMRDGPLGTDYPWMDGVLVEPYRATYFEAPTQSESAKWSVWPAGKIKTNAYNYKGRGFQHTFETTGTFLVEMKADGVVTQGRIFVKYVRREVRSLRGHAASALRVCVCVCVVSGEGGGLREGKTEFFPSRGCESASALSRDASRGPYQREEFTPFEKASVLHIASRVAAVSSLSSSRNAPPLTSKIQSRRRDEKKASASVALFSAKQTFARSRERNAVREDTHSLSLARVSHVSLD